LRGRLKLHQGKAQISRGPKKEKTHRKGELVEFSGEFAPRLLLRKGNHTISEANHVVGGKKDKINNTTTTTSRLL